MAEDEDQSGETEDGAETGGDLCDADAQLDDDEITPDEDLPAATGGVAE
jgi:hypothetical protein